MNFSSTFTSHMTSHVNRILRVLWIIFAALAASVYIVALVTIYFPLIYVCLQAAASHAAPPELGSSWEVFGLYITFINFVPMLVFYPTGLFIFGSKSRMALLVSATMIGLGAYVTQSVSLLGIVSYRHFNWLWWVILIVQQVGICCVPILFYVFPNGKFTPRWTRYIAMIWGLFVAALVVIRPGVNDKWYFPVTTAFLLLCFSTGIYAQVYRYRRVATLTEREQARWVILGLSLTAIIFVGLSLMSAITVALDITPSATLSLTVTMLFVLALLSIPISLVISVYRHHLWDIDLVINRALVYGTLTATLLIAYFISVILLQQLFHTMTGGQQSSLAIAVSTLVIALLFQPVRQRLQVFIDRKYFKRIDPVPATLSPSQVWASQPSSVAAMQGMAHVPVNTLPKPAPAQSPDVLEPLTEREIEVLELIAAGLSNREIAEKLVIAEGTVKRHVTNIYGKLDVRSRTQAIVKGRALQLIG